MEKIIKAKDINILKKLWEDAFGEVEYADAFYSKCFDDIDVYVIRDNEKIVSVLHFVPCVYNDGTQVQNGVYFYALTTEAGYRKRGLMNQLIKEALEEAKRRDYSFAFLIPAQRSLYKYYITFGFNEEFILAQQENVFFAENVREYVEEYLKNMTDSTGLICNIGMKEKIVGLKGWIPY